MNPILAYIDPSAMTYVLQLVVGIVIAGGAAFAYYFKKMKRKFGSKKEGNTEDYDTVEQIEYDNDDEFDIEKIEKDSE